MLIRIFSLFVFIILAHNVMGGKGKVPKQPLKIIVIDPGHGGRDGGAHGQISREAIVALEIGLKLRDALKKELPDVKILMTREEDELPGGLQNKDAALKWRAEFANQNNADLFISIHLNACGANQRYGQRVIGTKEQTYYVTTGKGKKKKKVAKTRTVNIYEKYKLPASVKGTQTYILARDWYERKVNAAGKKVEGEGDLADSASQDLYDLDPVQARIMAQQYAKYFFQKSLTLATYCEEEFAQQGRYSWGVLQRDWEGIFVLQATRMPSILVETGYVDHNEEERYLNTDKGQDEVAHAIVNAVKRYRDVLINPARASSANDTAVIADKKSQEKPLVVSVLKDRKTEVAETITTSSKELVVSFYDNAEVDGDTITVYDNNKAVISQQGLTVNPITIKVVFNDNETEHELVMVAHNLGRVPPNTALMIVQAGSKQYRINLTSSDEKNASVKFVYSP